MENGLYPVVTGKYAGERRVAQERSLKELREMDILCPCGLQCEKAEQKDLYMG
jgi:hypothetical protein